MATELMDPKMDAGLASAARSRVNSLEEAIAVRAFASFRGLSPGLSPGFRRAVVAV